MTTISFKEGQLATDSQVSLGNIISNNDFNKVQRFDSNEFGSVYIGAAGTLSHICEAFTFIEELFAGEQPDAIKFGPDQFNIVMLTEDGKLKEGILTEASTNIMWIDCEEPWAIGSGSQIAIGAMSAGKTAEEAVKIASQHDCYTNSNVKVYNASELSYASLLKAQRDALDEQIKMIEQESEDFFEEQVNNISVDTPLSRDETEIDKELLNKLKYEHYVEEEPSTIPSEVLMDPPEVSFEESSEEVISVLGKDKAEPVKGVVKASTDRAEVGVKYDWKSHVDELPSNLREFDEVRIYFRDGSAEVDDSPQTWSWKTVENKHDIVAYKLLKPAEASE